MGRYGVRGAVCAMVAGLTLAGCSAEPDAAGKDAAGKDAAGKGATGGTPAPSATASPTVPARGERLGAAGTPCVLPVSFETARHWTAEKVTVAEDPEFGDLAKQGTVTLVCEVDAKPAGHIGFIRVWTGTGKGGTARTALEAFVGAEKEAGKVRYRETTSGGLAATEVTYEITGEFLDEPKSERAFAVVTPGGPVVLHLGGLDSAEHRAMLPAYELAKKTLTLGS
ncbi:lipoprotein [Streptomyces sp. NPDC006368]|uniref:lipoprotein n=1 Tax=Streptomyces sp. NPDC006368 TaxID=3156760 RepID=UPI0033A1CAE7